VAPEGPQRSRDTRGRLLADAAPRLRHRDHDDDQNEQRSAVHPLSLSRREDLRLGVEAFTWPCDTRRMLYIVIGILSLVVGVAVALRYP
jgi:hypothetical protein